MPPPTILPKVRPYSVFYSFALIMDRFFKNTIKIRQTNCPKRPLPHGHFFIKNQFYTSISAFFCHQKVKSVFSKRVTIIRIFDTFLIFFCPHSSLKIQNVRQKSVKIKFTLVYWPFFSSNFLDFCPKSSPKISFFSSKFKFTLVYRPFFYLKKHKKWANLAIFFHFINDGFFIHIFRQKSNLH